MLDICYLSSLIFLNSLLHAGATLSNPSYLILECQPHCEIVCYQQKVHLPRIQAKLNRSPSRAKVFHWSWKRPSDMAWQTLESQASSIELPFLKMDYQIRCEVQVLPGQILCQKKWIKVIYCKDSIPPPNK